MYGAFQCTKSDACVRVGDGPVTGISATTGGDHFNYADGKHATEAKGDLWIQSTGGVGVVSSGGVTVGTEAGMLNTAGGDVFIWAGASMSPSLGSKDGPGTPPEAPTPPATDAEAHVNSLNALNAGVKATTETVQAWGDWDAAESGMEKLSAGYDVAKGHWEMMKAAADALSGGEPGDGFKQFSDGVDGVFGVADMIKGGAGAIGDKDMSQLPNLVGGILSGKKLAGAVAGKGPDAGKGGAPGAGKSGPGGGGKLEARAPAGIKKVSGADMEAIVSGKIEYKAGSNIAMNAFNKIETCSLVLEEHANIAATMRGLARAVMESLGHAKVDGKGKFTITTKGVGKVESSGTLDLESKGMMTIKGASGIKINGGPKINVYSSKLDITASSSAEIKSPKTKFCGELEITKNTFAKAELKGKELVVVKGSTFNGRVLMKKNLTVKSICKFG